MAKDINWTAVEAEYRAGLKSLPEIGREFGCSHVAVIKRAKRDGWARDLSARIKAKADDKVTRAAVTGAVTDTSKTVTENAIVEENATLLANLQVAHRNEWKDHQPLLASVIKKPKFEQARTAKVIAETIMIRQTGERRAWGIDKNGNGGDKLSDFLKIIIPQLNAPV